MATQTVPLTSRSTIDLGDRIETTGKFLLRYGLVSVIGWIGAMKFTAFEAVAIRPLVETSPLLGWLYRYFSLQAVSNTFGIFEISIAIMIAMRPVSARISALGSGLAVAMFLTTLTFLFSLPGWEPDLGGFPALSDAGGFLVKDLILLGASVWSLGEALTASSGARRLE